MHTAVKIVVDTSLDTETIAEIEMMRTLRLNHYRNVIRSPEKSLEILKRVGLTEATSPEQLKSQAIATINEIELRLKEPLVIYEEELTMYVETLSADEIED